MENLTGVLSLLTDEAIELLVDEFIQTATNSRDIELDALDYADETCVECGELLDTLDDCDSYDELPEDVKDAVNPEEFKIYKEERITDWLICENHTKIFEGSTWQLVYDGNQGVVTIEFTGSGRRQAQAMLEDLATDEWLADTIDNAIRHAL